jgi:effector-binding domain-containing protein
MIAPSDPSFLLCACAAAIPIMILCAAAPAQGRTGAEVKTLLAKIDAARGKPAQQPATLAIEGDYTVSFAGASEPVARGKFREVFAGTDRARHTSEMGEHGAMERGVTGELAWELDPALGAKVYAGAQAATVRRYFALLRGGSPNDLPYQEITHAGSEQLDGREHAVLRMTPAEGKADVWYVDSGSGHVTRIDIALPAPESADATFGLDDSMDSQITFGDWRKVGGVQFPHRRTLQMGPATVAFTCTKVEAGVRTDPAAFTPPKAVLELESRPASRAFDAAGKATCQIVERDAQRVASIRVKCKPDEISATLAVVLPEVMAHLNATGARMAGAPFSRYHAFGETEIDLEAGIPVAKPITEKGRVKNGELPAGKAVTAWHVGPYEKLGEAHGLLQAYVAANRLKPRGGPWEIYWTDPGMVPDPAKWRTQLFVAIEE